MSSQSHGFRFGVAPRVLGQKIINVTIGRIDDRAGQDTGMSG